jgi:hypothetical protein
MVKKTLVAACLLACTGAALAAAPQNQVPSCYAANKIAASAVPVDRDIFILLDQTVLLDAELQKALADASRAVLTPGTAFTILRFSAFSQNRYLDVVTAGVLEKPIPGKDRNDIGVKALKTFDACLKGQQDYGVKLALAAIGNTIMQSSADLAKSDVIASLSETSRIVKAAQAPRRIVFIVSDMLENSSVSSFYANNGVRKIDPVKELKGVETNRLFGDFGGASIFVMGAGIVPEAVGTKANKQSTIQYRDPKTLAALKQFWSDYFSHSNAKLEEFGMPAMLAPIH